MTVTYQGTWQSGHEPMNFDWRTDGSEGIVVQREMFGDLAMARNGMQTGARASGFVRSMTPWISDATELLKSFVYHLPRHRCPPECTGPRSPAVTVHVAGMHPCLGPISSTVEIEEIRALTTPKETL